MSRPSLHRRARPTPIGRNRSLALARGVTLIELMVVLTIVAIFLALGVPSLQNFFVSVRLAATTNDFAAALSMARTEAIKRGYSVVMKTSSGAPADWGNGWRICADVNNNRDCDAGEEIIRVGQPVGAPVTVYASNGLAGAIAFRADGRFFDTPLTGPGGAVVVCYGTTSLGPLNNQPRSRAILVNSSGRIRVATDANGDGIPESDAGSNIGGTCLAPTP